VTIHKCSYNYLLIAQVFQLVYSFVKSKYAPFKGSVQWEVGQGRMHYETLTKIFLLNIVILPVTSNKSHNNACIVITDDYYYC